VAVVLCTAFQGFGTRERLFVSWVGLRGAVPIVLATFPLSAGLDESDTIFNAVFFVVLVSALLQGLTLAPLARALGLATEARPVHAAPIEVGAVRALGADILELEIDEDDAAAGRAIRKLALPPSALIALIVRDGRAVAPRGSTVIEPGDRVYVLGGRRDRGELEARLRGQR
jgi:cell volume regulation protein A